MYVSEIRYPGTALDGLTEKDASDVENLCRHIVDGLEEAAVALASFPEARANMRPAQRETDAISSEDRDKIAATRRSAQEAGASAEDVGAMYYDGEQAIKRELWRQGRWPDLYMRKRPFMFARDFVLGLDQVAKGARIEQTAMLAAGDRSADDAVGECVSRPQGCSRLRAAW